MSVQSAELHLDHERRRALLNGRPIALGGRAFDLLLTMAAQPGRVCSQAELFEAAWPGRVMDETNLRAQIRKLPVALGDHSIVNFSSRGDAYRQRLAQLNSALARAIDPERLADLRTEAANLEPAHVHRTALEWRHSLRSQLAPPAEVAGLDPARVEPAPARRRRLAT